jgi:hypothetical protein
MPHNSRFWLLLGALLASAGCGGSSTISKGPVTQPSTDSHVNPFGPIPPPLATSDQAELQEIRIHHDRTANSVPEADLDYAEIFIWFPLPTTQSMRQLADDVSYGRLSYSIQLTSIDSIKDDRDTELLTPKRKDSIPQLRYPRSSGGPGADGRHGPVLRIQVDAPARDATIITRVRGVAEVRRLRMQLLTFDNIAAKVGKPLNHELMDGVQITPLDFKLERNWINCRIQVSDPSRIAEWGPIKNGRGLRPQSITGGEEEVILERAFSGSNTTKGLSLGVEFGVVEESRTFQFEFENIALP